MSLSKPIAVLSAGCLMLATVAAVAQSGGSAQGSGNANARVLVLKNLARIDAVERSKVVALREGVIEKMELQIGMPVQKGGVIGVLHHKIAELTVRKNHLQATAVGPEEKAKAQKDVAISVVARNQALNRAKPGLVSEEDVRKAEGELEVAEAQLHEARENRTIAEAELALAERILVEHTILAPFDGVVIERKKNPGESVRANDALVELVNLNKLCADAFVPLEYVYQVAVGQVVEIQPGRMVSPDGKLGKDREFVPITKKRYRGKITFIHPGFQPVGEEGVKVRVAFDNPGDLRPGMQGQVTIFLNPNVAANDPDAAGPTRTAGTQ
jgi:RND family efflux transporter MFP subunit